MSSTRDAAATMRSEAIVAERRQDGDGAIAMQSPASQIAEGEHDARQRTLPAHLLDAEDFVVVALAAHSQISETGS